MNLRDQILQASDLPTEAVEVPEWDCTVYVRSMTGVERDAFEVAMMKLGNNRLNNMRGRLATLCLVDESGARIFDDGDMKVVGAKSAKALDRIFAVAQRINGLSDADVDAIVKN